jgi:hypothetical protein
MKTNRERKPKANWTTAFPKQLRQSPQRTRNQTQKPWRGIRAVSKSRARKNAEYERTKRAWWPTVKGSWCPVMGEIFGKLIQVCKKPHHIRGRDGSLLCETRWWLAVADPDRYPAHRWIHDHPEEAQRHGWLASAGQWGKAD